MRKVQLTAVVWTMILAIPFTALALSAVAYTTEHLTQISTAIANFNLTTSAGGRGLVLEFAQRWPELAGMIIGQAVILMILLIARQSAKAESSKVEDKKKA
jgi:DMSO/TMAO reductase YedYZ heme-binding membrane subunit